VSYVNDGRLGFADCRRTFPGNQDPRPASRLSHRHPNRSIGLDWFGHDCGVRAGPSEIAKMKLRFGPLSGVQARLLHMAHDGITGHEILPLLRARDLNQR